MMSSQTATTLLRRAILLVVSAALHLAAVSGATNANATATTTEHQHHDHDHGASSSATDATHGHASASNLNQTTLIPATYEDVEDVPTEQHEEVYNFEANPLALTLPRIAAFISLLGVICVALEAYQDFQADQRHYRVHHTYSGRSNSRKVPVVTHIQLFFQIPLLCQAIAFGLGSNPAPAFQDYIWGASGNVQTCSLQGFLVQFSMIGSVGWDVSLSTAYLLMARYHYRLQNPHSCWYLHAIIWPITLLMSIFPLMQGMYNFNTTLCWLETYPNDCGLTEDSPECERGDGALAWQMITSFLGILHLLYSMGVTMTLYCIIRGLETHTNKRTSHNHNPQTSYNTNADTGVTVPQRRYSRAIAIQGMLYASGIIVTVLPSVIVIVLYNVVGIWSDGFSIFATTSAPLMGYVNFLVFMRGRQPEECHTRYAKLLRRAHSWLFDRQWCGGCRGWFCLLVFCCQCPFKVEWVGFQERIPTSTHPMDETFSTTHRHTGDISTSASDRGEIKSWDELNLLNQQQPKHDSSASHMPTVEEKQEEGAAEDTRATATSKKWLGFVISWGSKKDSQVSQVSELGESIITATGTGTNPPVVQSKPQKKNSDSGTTSIRPPVHNSHWSRTEHDKLPTKPQREQSEFTLESSLASFGSPYQQSASASASASYRGARGGGLPSIVSEMTLEEIEDWHYSSHSNPGQMAPPAKPERYVSEVESESVAESSACCQVDENNVGTGGGGGGGADQASADQASFAACSSSRGGDQESFAACSNKSGRTSGSNVKGGTPASSTRSKKSSSLSAGMKATMRIVEKAILGGLADEQQQQQQQQANKNAPPLQPERYISIISDMNSTTDEDDDDEINVSSRGIDTAKKPPSPPQRYVSEVDPLSTDDDDDDNDYSDDDDEINVSNRGTDAVKTPPPTQPSNSVDATSATTTTDPERGPGCLEFENAIIRGSLRASMQLPERFESEVDSLELNDAKKRSSSAQGPKQPERFESEVDTLGSDSDYSDDHLEELHGAAFVHPRTRLVVGGEVNDPTSCKMECDKSSGRYTATTQWPSNQELGYGLNDDTHQPQQEWPSVKDLGYGYTDDQQMLPSAQDLGYGEDNSYTPTASRTASAATSGASRRCSVTRYSSDLAGSGEVVEQPCQLVPNASAEDSNSVASYSSDSVILGVGLQSGVMRTSTSPSPALPIHQIREPASIDEVPRPSNFWRPGLNSSSSSSGEATPSFPQRPQSDSHRDLDKGTEGLTTHKEKLQLPPHSNVAGTREALARNETAADAASQSNNVKLHQQTSAEKIGVGPRAREQAGAGRVTQSRYGKKKKPGHPYAPAINASANAFAAAPDMNNFSMSSLGSTPSPAKLQKLQDIEDLKARKEDIMNTIRFLKDIEATESDMQEAMDEFRSINKELQKAMKRRVD